MAKSFQLLKFLLVANALLVVNSDVDTIRKKFIHLNTTKDRAYFPFEYYLSIATSSWSGSRLDCLNFFGEDAYLLEIRTEEEFDYVKKMIEDSGHAGKFWTSAQYDQSTDMYRWSTDNAPIPKFIDWTEGHPTSSPSPLHKVGYNQQNRYLTKLYTAVDSEITRYICQYPRNLKRSMDRERLF